MAQPVNSTVELTTAGVSYPGMEGRVGKSLLGDKGLKSYSDVNVKDCIQVPWENIEEIGTNVSRDKASRHLEVLTNKSKFLFALKDSGKTLEIACQHTRNDKVVRILALVQTIAKGLSRLVKGE